MTEQYETIPQSWDPWSFIPQQYNLGTELTSVQVRQGRGDHVALHWENAIGDRATVSYRQLDQLSNRLAVSLQRLGVRRGDRVFMRLPNLPEFYVSALAIAKLGGIFIPSSTQFRGNEIEYRLKDSSAVAVITTAGLLDSVEEVAGNCPDLRHVIVTSYPDHELRVGNYIDFARLVSDEIDVHLGNWEPADTRSDDIAFIAYTSGTTGDPKGVVHYHRYPVSYESLIRCWHDYRSDDVVACPAELGWLLPVASTFLYALSRGLTIVLYDNMGQRFDPLTWFRLFDRYRISNFTATPTIFRMMMTADRARDVDLSSWRHAVTAGEPLPADTFTEIQRQFHVTPLDGIGDERMHGVLLQYARCGNSAW